VQVQQCAQLTGDAAAAQARLPGEQDALRAADAQREAQHAADAARLAAEVEKLRAGGAAQVQPAPAHAHAPPLSPGEALYQAGLRALLAGSQDGGS
jgi:hypothetical protein